jgi:hypothetical protein
MIQSDKPAPGYEIQLALLFQCSFVVGEGTVQREQQQGEEDKWKQHYE